MRDTIYQSFVAATVVTVTAVTVTVTVTAVTAVTCSRTISTSVKQYFG